MTTLSDLRAAFAELERRAPVELPDSVVMSTPAWCAGPLRSAYCWPVDRRVQSVRPRFGRRRLAVMVSAGAAAVIVMAIAVLAPWVSHRSAHNSNSAATGFEPLAVTDLQFTLNALPGYTVWERHTSATEQSVTLTNNDPSGYSTVTLYAAGSWHPSRQPNATDVKVGPASGFYGPIVFDAPPAESASAAAGAPGRGSGLVWQDPSGYWLSVTRIDQASSKVPNFQPISMVQSVGIAEAVNVGEPQALTLPIKLAYLPAGLAVHDVTLGGSGDSGLITSVQLGPVGRNTVTFDIIIDPTGAVTNARSHSGNGSARTGSYQPLDVSGFTGEYTRYDNADTQQGGGSALLSRGKYWLNFYSESPSGAFGASSPDRMSSAEIVKIVSGVTLPATPGDPTTWFDAADALPR